MSNNKQSSVEWFIDQLEEKGDAWENVSIRRVQISIDVSEYMELKTKAKAMHKVEIVNAVDGFPIHTRHMDGEEYYEEIFEGEK